MATYVYNGIHIYRVCTNNGNTRKYRNKIVCVDCTDTMLFFCLFVLYSVSVNALQIVFCDSLYESTAKWETSQIFRGQIVDAHLVGASVTKTATLLGVSRAAVTRVLTTYTNHGRTSSTRGIVVKNQN